MELLNYIPQLLALLSLYGGGLAIYRLYLSPLAKFPGPKLAAATRLYEAFYDIIRNGQYTFKIRELHERYGPIVRISPYELHVSDPDFYPELYCRDGKWNKYGWAYDAFGAKLSTVCTIDHETHRRRRAPLNPFFSKVSVSAKQGILKTHVSKLCARIAQFAGTGTSVNLGHAISAYTRDVSLDFILGKEHNSIEQEDFNAPMTNVVKGCGGLWRVTKHIRFVGPLLLAMPLEWAEKTTDAGTKAFLGLVKDMNNLSKETIAAHGESEKAHSPRTLLQDILDSSLAPKEKSLGRLSDEVGTITGAAFETSAQTTRMILYHLYSNRDILSNVRDELRNANIPADVADMTLSSLERLPYLTSVIMEGLRLSPALATRTARIAPDRNLYYKQWTIPAGTPVGMTTLLMHHDESIYPEPAKFEPRRWLDIEARKRSDRILGSFSRGTRNCLGMHLAWAEMYLVVAGLAQKFDFEFDGTSSKDLECVGDQFIIRTANESQIKVFVNKK